MFVHKDYNFSFIARNKRKGHPSASQSALMLYVCEKKILFEAEKGVCKKMSRALFFIDCLT